MNLFLITKHYPYTFSEQYLNKELQVISVFFKKIYIYPNDFYGEGTIKVNLPDNIEVINLNENITKVKGKFFYDILLMLNIFLHELFFSKDTKFLLLNLKWNLIQIWTQIKISYVLINFLKENKLNECVFYSYWFHKSALLLSILKEKKVIRHFVSRAHSIDLYHHEWPIKTKQVKVPPFQYFKLKNVSLLFTISEHGEKFLKTLYPQFSYKISKAYLGVELSNKIKINKTDEFTIVTCSGLDFNKRVHLLAIALLKVSFPFKWIHFGDGPFREKILNYSENFKNGQIFKLMGYVPHEKVLDFYKINHVDVFVNVSKVEGIPVSIMEAMSFGIPAIATKSNGVPELVIDNYNGFLLENDFKIDELINKLNELYNNPQLLKQFSENSLKIIIDRFNAEKNYTSFTQEILKISK